MRIAVCDDDPKDQDDIVQVLRNWDPGQSTECFSDGASLLEAAKVLPPFDIVFLDIYLPSENGIDIAGELQEFSPETGIAFITTSREYAVEAFSLGALHYLVKPVAAQDVTETLRRLAALRANRRATFSFVVGRDSHTVFLDQICCFECTNHAVEISLDDGRRLKVWMPLAELEQKLDRRFLKINRGTLVNMDHIEQMGIDVCILRDGKRLPVTKRGRTAIRTAYNDYLFSMLSRRKGFDEVRL